MLLGDYLGALDHVTSDVEVAFPFAFAGKANAFWGGMAALSLSSVASFK